MTGFHPTKITIVGVRNGIEFQALMDFDRFEELIKRCNREYAPNSPISGPELVKAKPKKR